MRLTSFSVEHLEADRHNEILGDEMASRKCKTNAFGIGDCIGSGANWRKITLVQCPAKLQSKLYQLIKASAPLSKLSSQ
jgi:hypothetical protein